MGIFDRFKKLIMGIFDRFRRKEHSASSQSATDREGQEKKISTGKEKSEKSVKAAKPSRPVKVELRKFDDVHNILIRPLVTEKISNLGMHNQYAFEVSADVNKVQIKKAIETYYQVRPVKVRLMNIQGKNVRWGRRQGRTKSRKKAMVTLRQGDKIELYEGV